MIRVTFTLDGRSSTFDMSSNTLTIIEGADAAGIELPTQCRAGICATCRARLVSGAVHMRDQMALDDREIADGFVLACQSEPRSNEITVNFDEQP
jgi:ring-1,2-phenylacetyl-CoA epoxidase subunit PaaE